MLEICCRLTCLLNELCAGRTTAPHAEAELLEMVAAHHVHDPEEVLGLSEHDPLSSVPIRMALARISHAPHDSPVFWGLLLPAPGQLAGLRGPARVNHAALDAGAVIICHQGSDAVDYRPSSSSAAPVNSRRCGSPASFGDDGHGIPAQ